MSPPLAGPSDPYAAKSHQSHSTSLCTQDGQFGDFCAASLLYAFFLEKSEFAASGELPALFPMLGR